MPPAAPSTELFGFSEPTVKSGEVFVPIRTVGGRALLHGPQALLIDLAHAILAATGAVLVRDPAAHDVQIHVRPAGPGRWMTPGRRLLLDTALAAWEAGNETQDAIASRYGISVYALRDHRERRREEKSRARAPITKPAGHIL